MLALIVAVAQNRVIGQGDSLPWHLPKDLAFFKEHTLNKMVVMGRKTWQTLPIKPLPKRQNAVLSHQKLTLPDEVIQFSNVASILSHARTNDVMVIGGGQLYESTLAYAEKLYITRVEDEFSGDVFFPELDLTDWDKIFTQKNLPDERHLCPFTFEIYQRTLG